MRVSYSTLVKAKRAGRATSVLVTPTGTAADQYQIPLGNRHSLREVGVIGLPSWSDRATQTETWVRVPRLSATCPRRVTVFDGGRSAAIDRVMEFGDEFDGGLDTTKWTVAGAYAITGGVLSLGSGSAAFKYLDSTASFADGYAIRARATLPRSTAGYPRIGFETGAVGIWNSYEDQTHTWLQYNAGAAHQQIALLDTNYHTLGAGRVSGSARFTVDGTAYTQATGAATATSIVRCLTYDAGQYLNLDWILVRKFAANEPLTGTVKPNATNRALSRPMRKADTIRACCT